MKPCLPFILSVCFGAALAMPAIAQQPEPVPPDQAASPDPLKDALTEAPPAVEGGSSMSDKEETGAMTDMLPGFVDPLTLPEDQSAAAGSLFPAEIWPLPAGDEPELPYEMPLGAAAEEGGALSPEVIASSFGESPAPALHDPLGLLPPADARDLSTLLERSINGRGGFQISLVLLGGAQQVPVSIDFDALIQRWHGTGKGALVVYYAGHPERTLAWFSPAALTEHREENLRMLMDLGMKEAARLGSPLQQLQRFCFKTAIRLDRLHRQGDVSPSDEIPAVLAAVQPQTSGSMLWWAFAIGVQAAGLAGAAVWWLRRKRLVRRRGEIIVLPPQEITPRLGGAHSGGYGALLVFGSAVAGK